MLNILFALGGRKYLLQLLTFSLIHFERFDTPCDLHSIINQNIIVIHEALSFYIHHQTPPTSVHLPMGEPPSWLLTSSVTADLFFNLFTWNYTAYNFLCLPTLSKHFICKICLCDVCCWTWFILTETVANVCCCLWALGKFADWSYCYCEHAGVCLVGEHKYIPILSVWLWV